MPQNYHLFSVFYELFPKQNSLLDYYHKPPQPIIDMTAPFTLKAFTGSSATQTFFTSPHPNRNTKHTQLTFLPSSTNGESEEVLFFSFFQWVISTKTKQCRVIAYLGNILYFRATNPEWRGVPFQTSLTTDSSQAASKMLSVYCSQLSSTKSQTCTSVTVERQKAIHTPTMAPAAKDSHQEMEGRVNGMVDLRYRKELRPLRKLFG